MWEISLGDSQPRGVRLENVLLSLTAAANKPKWFICQPRFSKSQPNQLEDIKKQAPREPVYEAIAWHPITERELI